MIGSLKTIVFIGEDNCLQTISRAQRIRDLKIFEFFFFDKVPGSSAKQ